MVSRSRILLPMDRIAEFCRRWKVVEFSLFGSVLCDDFRPDSDVDVLVTFAPDAEVSLWDWGAMQDELGAIFGRQVDLVERGAITNPFRHYAILHDYEVVYDA
jgi:predicted nucleotidyltransferase